MDAVGGRVGKVQKETWNDKEMQNTLRAGDTTRRSSGGGQSVSL